VRGLTRMKIFTAFIAAAACLPACVSPEPDADLDRDEIAAPRIAALPVAGMPAALPSASGSLAVIVGAHARVDHRYLWDMAMTDPAPIELAPGATRRVSFPVDIKNTGVVDTGAVTGTIQIYNFGRRGVDLIGVLAQVGEVAATVSCTSPFPITMRAGSSLACSYTVSLPDARDRSVVAVAYGSDVAFAIQPVVFSDPATEQRDLDRVVEATAPGVGHVYLTDARFEPVVHTSFSREVGPYSACGPFTFVATSNLRALDGSGSVRSGLLAINRSATVAGVVVCGLR
jgi:hypothetical protein